MDPKSPRSRVPVPRRIVRYRLQGDALGPYVTFALDVVVLPEDIPPYKLPPGITLEWKRLDCRFTPGDISLGAQQLHEHFLEFAEAMGWEARQD